LALWGDGVTRKRKATPRHQANPQAWLVAIQGACLLSLDDRTVWALQFDAALDAVRRGQADQAAWACIFDAINLAEALVLMRVARDDAGLIAAAQQACVAILDRQRATGTRAARASELAALRELQGAWVDLLAGITHSQRFRAEELVARRTRAAQAGGMGAQVRVIDAAGLPA